MGIHLGSFSATAYCCHFHDVSDYKINLSIIPVGRKNTYIYASFIPHRIHEDKDTRFSYWLLLCFPFIDHKSNDKEPCLSLSSSSRELRWIVYESWLMNQTVLFQWVICTPFLAEASRSASPGVNDCALPGMSGVSLFFQSLKQVIFHLFWMPAASEWRVLLKAGKAANVVSGYPDTAHEGSFVQSFHRKKIEKVCSKESGFHLLS